MKKRVDKGFARFVTQGQHFKILDRFRGGLLCADENKISNGRASNPRGALDHELLDPSDPGLEAFLLFGLACGLERLFVRHGLLSL